MICKTYGNSADTSTYIERPGSRKELNYTQAWKAALTSSQSDATYTQDEAIADVIAAYNLKGRELLELQAPNDRTVDDNEAIPIQIYSSCRPVIVETYYSANAAAIVKNFFRVLSLPSGEHEYFVRKKGKGVCIELCGSPIAGIDLGGRHKKGLYAGLRDMLHNLYMENKLWDFELTLLEAEKYGCAKRLTQMEYVNTMILEAYKKYPKITPTTLVNGEPLTLNRMVALRPFLPKEPDVEDLFAMSYGYDRMFPDLTTALGPEESPKSIFTRYLSYEKECEMVEIPPTITNDPTMPAFSFVDTTQFVDGLTPNFDSFVSRIEEPCREYFMALFYAPMIARSKHRKITWIKSQGFDGKSTLFNALSEYLGGGVVGFFSTNSLKGDFGLEPLIGKRILIMSDCQNPLLLHTQAIHNITGGDIVSVNRKNQKEIHVRFNARLFVGSNTPPDLRSVANQESRLAYIPMNPPKKEHLIRYCYCDPKTGEPLYEDHEKTIPKLKGSRMESGLVAEMPHILFKCRVAYEKLCEDDLEIMPPPGVRDIMLRDCGSDEEDAYSTFFKKYCDFDETYSMPFKDILDKYMVFTKESARQMQFISPALKRYLDEQRNCKTLSPTHRKGEVTITYGLRFKKVGDSER